MMQRIEISNNSNTPNFIGSWMLKDTNMCDEIVNFFEENPIEQSIGKIGGGVDESQKKSTDIQTCKREEICSSCCQCLWN